MANRVTGFTATTFLSSFLLFEVQPLMGRSIVPWFGGAASVWLTCVLFFQVCLLVGYAYADWLSRRFSARAQAWTHLALLAASLVLLPITPGAQWRPGPGQAPVARIFLLLLFSVGGPYVVVASTGPLLQHWFTTAAPGRSPYRLYALSNAAALLALVSYPALIEPSLPLIGQAVAWSGLYAVFALAAGWRAVAVIRGERGATPHAVRDHGIRVPPGTVAWWLGLAATGSAMLLATTNQLTQEVASVPLLWVLPLSIYLLTFTICFDHERWYQRRVFGPLLAVMAVLAVAFLVIGTRARLWTQIAVYCGVLFACCMTCHGELVRSRPAPRQLTLFYLTVAAGGALGGAFVSLIAPTVFRGFWELHVALGCSCVLGLVAVYRDAHAVPKLLAVGVAGLGVALVLQAGGDRGDTIYTERNFYGVVRVAERRDTLGAIRVLLNGRIAHGSQYLSAAERRRPVAYFDSASGVGLALAYAGHAARARGQGVRVGVVGLGAGTLAAYGEPGDVFRFYELNPAVPRVARQFFSYLADSKARVEIAVGDGRIQLENELLRGGSQQFNVLVIDAFSSDAIPAHLLTVECVALYLRHLKTDGLLLFHVSNRYVDLRPVIRGLVARFRLRGMWIVHGGRVRPGVLGSSWMIIGRPGNPIFEAKEVTASASAFPADLPPILWTDDRQSVWRVLRFR